MANRRSVSYRAVPEFTEAKELVQQVVCRLKVGVEKLGC